MVRRPVQHLVFKLVVELDREGNQHVGEKGRDRDSRGFLLALVRLYIAICFWHERCPLHSDFFYCTRYTLVRTRCGYRH